MRRLQRYELYEHRNDQHFGKNSRKPLDHRNEPAQPKARDFAGKPVASGEEHDRASPLALQFLHGPADRTPTAETDHDVGFDPPPDHKERAVLATRDHWQRQRRNA